MLVLRPEHALVSNQCLATNYLTLLDVPLSRSITKFEYCLLCLCLDVLVAQLISPLMIPWCPVKDSTTLYALKLFARAISPFIDVCRHMHLLLMGEKCLKLELLASQLYHLLQPVCQGKKQTGLIAMEGIT